MPSSALGIPDIQARFCLVARLARAGGHAGCDMAVFRVEPTIPGIHRPRIEDLGSLGSLWRTHPSKIFRTPPGHRKVCQLFFRWDKADESGGDAARDDLLSSGCCTRLGPSRGPVPGQSNGQAKCDPEPKQVAAPHPRSNRMLHQILDNKRARARSLQLARQPHRVPLPGREGQLRLAGDHCSLRR